MSFDQLRFTATFVCGKRVIYKYQNVMVQYPVVLFELADKTMNR